MVSDFLCAFCGQAGVQEGYTYCDVCREAGEYPSCSSCGDYLPNNNEAGQLCESCSLDSVFPDDYDGDITSRDANTLPLDNVIPEKKPSREVLHTSFCKASVNICPFRERVLGYANPDDYWY